MNEETELDVFAAADYLKTNKQIDASNIIILGHGQGGYALPKIIQTDKTGIFKAGIIMSGFTRPLYEVLTEQFEYFVKKEIASKSQLEYFQAQTKILNDPNFIATKPPKEYTLGYAYYHSYMKEYKVLEQASKIDKPILVLQGERDYQVNPKTDFEGWKKAFKDRQDVEFKLYPKLNHFYIEGESDSTPKEYDSGGNIPQYVIDDIVIFINKIL